MKKRLFFLTEAFPYGHGEQFIEAELPQLIDQFAEVIIIPLSYSSKGTMREIDSRVTVMKPILKKNKIYKYLAGFLNFSPILIFLSALFRANGKMNLRKMKFWLISTLLTRSILASYIPAYLRENTTENDVIYSYWGTGLGLIFPFIKNINAKKVVRLHAGDLYEYSTPLFLRRELFSSVDAIVLISEDGKSYLTNLYPQYSNKTTIFSLGTEDYGIVQPSSDGVFRIVSCSHAKKVKRIHLITGALMLCTEKDVKIEWTHIGDGATLAELKIQAMQLPKNITAIFRGSMPNSAVLQLYQESEIDLFLNVSEREGLPVSIMEALSFGIPVIATDVGGTKEIVREEKFLLNKDFEVVELKNKILELKYNANILELRRVLRERWIQDYDSKNNHAKFAQFLVTRK